MTKKIYEPASSIYEIKIMDLENEEIIYDHRNSYDDRFRARLLIMQYLEEKYDNAQFCGLGTRDDIHYYYMNYQIDDKPRVAAIEVRYLTTFSKFQTMRNRQA